MPFFLLRSPSGRAEPAAFFFPYLHRAQPGLPPSSPSSNTGSLSLLPSPPNRQPLSTPEPSNPTLSSSPNLAALDLLPKTEGFSSPSQQQKLHQKHLLSKVNLSYIFSSRLPQPASPGFSGLSPSSPSLLSITKPRSSILNPDPQRTTTMKIREDEGGRGDVGCGRTRTEMKSVMTMMRSSAVVALMLAVTPVIVWVLHTFATKLLSRYFQYNNDLSSLSINGYSL